MREAQHNLASLLREVELGEEFRILRRKQPIARISPITTNRPQKQKIDWSDLAEKRKAIWKNRSSAGTSVDELLDDLRGES